VKALLRAPDRVGGVAMAAELAASVRLIEGVG